MTTILLQSSGALQLSDGGMWSEAGRNNKSLINSRAGDVVVVVNLDTKQRDIRVDLIRRSARLFESPSGLYLCRSFMKQDTWMLQASCFGAVSVCRLAAAQNDQKKPVTFHPRPSRCLHPC